MPIQRNGPGSHFRARWSTHGRSVRSFAVPVTSLAMVRR
jgi:hypothetical protein